PTAEQTFTLMMAIAHRTAELDRKMRLTNEIRIGVMNNLGISLYGKTLGIIGMGRIGRSVAKRAVACGMRVIYHNRHRLDMTLEKDVTYVDDQMELIKQSDFLIPMVPYTKDTHHLIDANVFNSMKQGAVLVNTSRGAVVDEKALVDALKSGKLWGAALDVYEFEPNISPELLTLDNVVMSPHIGTGTIDGRIAMCRRVSENIAHVWDGNPDVDWVVKSFE
ncbi:MAG: NAD(P)-dependent oxidoreductase, partial [Bacteroidales bacterium]|nr:NAD(P)-dependent oxidoreductase [Bacteroidales bacterium]